MTCHNLGGGLIVCTPTIEKTHLIGSHKRWCFGCRRKTTYVDWAFLQEWYGWTETMYCSECGDDRSRGFGI